MDLNFQRSRCPVNISYKTSCLFRSSANLAKISSNSCLMQPEVDQGHITPIVVGPNISSRQDWFKSQNGLLTESPKKSAKAVFFEKGVLPLLNLKIWSLITATFLNAKYTKCLPYCERVHGSCRLFYEERIRLAKWWSIKLLDHSILHLPLQTKMQ